MNHNSNGFIKLMKTHDAGELMEGYPNAYRLLSIIAWRAKRRPGFNRHGLEIGEALIGDFNRYKMTEQQYRTAKRILETNGFATFRPTNKGTIATIVDSRVYDINPEQTNGQITTEETVQQRATNEPLTTNEEVKKGKKERNKKNNDVEAEGILTYLNEKTGRHFQAVDTTLSHIRNRLGEVAWDVEGVKRMIDHQCERWNGTDMQEYLRPSTLFRKEKFHEYFANRNMPAKPRPKNEHDRDIDRLLR